MSLRRRFPIPMFLALTALTCVSSSVVAPWSVAVASLATRRRWREVVPFGLFSLLVPRVYALVNPVSGNGAPGG